MPLNPRTPVVVGVGQSIERPDQMSDLDSRRTPLSLMIDAVHSARSEASKVNFDVDEMIAIPAVSWTVANPAAMVAHALRFHADRLLKTPTGGDVPQRMIHSCSQRILAGELDSVIICGSEAVYSASAARRANVTLNWETQDESVNPAALTGEEKIPFTENEYSHGLVWPTEVYPLFENARRHRLGWTIDQQRERLGTLWSNFARVASTNPYAWITNAPSAEVIATPSPTNRYVGFPYTKFLVANMPVDMGAAVILMSYEMALRYGVSRDQMVFPHVGAHGHDHWFVSDRVRLDDSVAMREIVAELGTFGVTRDDLAHVDLYSCFPTVVQTAADALGLDAFDPRHVPTVTGGLTFGGGPGNNYVTHSIATMVTKLRSDPTEIGLVTGVGWYSTKHAWGVYGASPPVKEFRASDVQSAVDATDKVMVRQDDGDVVVESYVVAHRHDGARKKLVIASRFGDGSRVWSSSADDTLMQQFESTEMIGSTGRISGGVFSV